MMLSLLYSLFLDNSSTVCTAGLTLVVKALPFFALYAVTDLKDALPNLLAILARTLSWRQRPATTPRDKRDILAEEEFEHEIEDDVGGVLHIRPDVEWERLETTFTATPSLPPSSRAYFTFLYYLYPCNVLRFLRHPVQYLDDADLESPYVETWEKALNADKIRRQSEVRIFSFLHVLGNEPASRTYCVNMFVTHFWCGAMLLQNYPNLAFGSSMTYLASLAKLLCSMFVPIH